MHKPDLAQQAPSRLEKGATVPARQLYQHRSTKYQNL